METYLLWLVAGFLLVIAELVSGTFYLLVLGISAFAGGASAWAGLEPGWQALAAAGVALAGFLWVSAYRRREAASQMPSLDAGQPATFDHWVDRTARQARVKYRDALWDASVSGEISGEPGEVLYVVSIDGNTVKVAKDRQA